MADSAVFWSNRVLGVHPEEAELTGCMLGKQRVPRQLDGGWLRLPLQVQLVTVSDVKLAP